MSKARNSEQPAAHAEDPFLGVSAAADQLGVSHTTITRWVHDRLMTAVMFPGNRLMIRQSEVDKWKTNYVNKGGIQKKEAV